MSNQPDRKNRPPSPPPAARKPAAGSAKAPAPGAPRPEGEVTRPLSGGSRPPTGAPRSTGGTTRPLSGGSRPPSSATRPASGARGGKPVTSRPIAPASKGLRPLDLALITAGIVVVGVLIWFVAGGMGSAPTANNVSSNAVGNPGAGSTSGDVGLSAPVSATLEAIYNTYNVTPVPAGQPAPGFTLPGADEKTYSLSDYKGKVVVLEFFAPWCPHCQEDAPIFNQINQKYQGQDVQILAVSASPFGHNYSETNSDLITMGDVTWFRDNFQVQFPMLFDPYIKTASAYGVTRFPTVFVVDKNGNLAGQVENPPTVEKVTALVDQALQGGGAAPAAGQ